MSNPTDTLSQMIDALVNETRVARRRTHANAAYAALRQLLEAQPPANSEEAEQRGFRKGLMRAVELAKQARETHEWDVAAAEAVAGRGAYTVLTGVRNYGQFITSTFEPLALNAALDETPNDTGESP